ncbi:MAG: hypothetical protein FJZ00_08650, partial [Candidatus Sericytochromatia bacterium]|nr:hypothetical protein [Candidatus Tanganyikabacteria bacterium]
MSFLDDARLRRRLAVAAAPLLVAACHFSPVGQIGGQAPVAEGAAESATLEAAGAAGDAGSVLLPAEPAGVLRGFEVVDAGMGLVDVTFQIDLQVSPDYRVQVVPPQVTHYKLVAKGAGMDQTTAITALLQDRKITLRDLIVGDKLALNLSLYHLDGGGPVLGAYGEKSLVIPAAKTSVAADLMMIETGPALPRLPVGNQTVTGSFLAFYSGVANSDMNLEALAKSGNPACRTAFTVKAGTLGSPFATRSGSMPSSVLPAKMTLPAAPGNAPARIPLIVRWDNSACNAPPTSIQLVVRPVPASRPTAPPPPVSRFDADGEGWASSGDPVSTPPSWSGSGGNPGGRISNTDGAGGQIWYFDAPGKFLGQKFGLYDKTLSYDLKQSANDSQFNAHDIILEGNGRKLVYRFPIGPGTDWTRYAVALREAGWKTVSGSSEANSVKADMEAVLANISRLRSRERVHPIQAASR